jgi:transcriptional regulator with PAS, ATPase and Fis domain
MKKTDSKKQSNQLKLLSEISIKLQTLIDAEDTNQFYQDIVDLIRNKLDFYAIQFWSVSRDQTKSRIKLRGQSGAYSRHMEVGHILNVEDAGITGVVIKTKESYLSNDTSQDPNFTNLSLPINSNSELCVPVLRSDGEVIATINVESDQKNAFDEEDQITLEAVASQVGVAVNNRKIFRDTKHFNRQLQKVVEDKTSKLRDANERIISQQKQLEKENKTLKSIVNKDAIQYEIIGESVVIQNLIGMVDKIAPTQASVLIQGESGTGKELIARRLHTKSDRNNSTFVSVNCGALQESLLESELFGHERGSFTGAIGQKLGLVEMADGGTLFLDEIGEMSLNIQAKLLRFLQEGEFYRIGGKKPLKVSVRVVSATNRDLELEVKAGKFREDLFYRLNTITLRMPPLRKRSEDIPALVEFFLRNSRFGGPAGAIKKVDPKAIEAFQAYDWPGNIRELQNTVERLKILAENNEIRLEDLPFGIRSPKISKTTISEDYQFELPLEEVEKQHILRSLAFHHGNKTKTAESLGITIKTLYNKLYRYGVLKQGDLKVDESNQVHYKHGEGAEK